MIREQFDLLGSFFVSGFKKTILFCAAGFIAASMIGCIVGHAQPNLIEEVLNSFAQTVEDAGIVNDDGTFSPFALMANNWSAMLLSAAYGFLPFLFFPAISLFTNGFLIGIMAAMYQISGYSMALFFAALIPHGIFELPALVLSIACGIHLCIRMNQMILGKTPRPSMLETLCDLLRVLVLLVAPLTIAAGFIEAYITPWFMTLFM